MASVRNEVVRTRFNRSAATYDEAAPCQEGMADALVRRVRDLLGGRSPARILELGCGTGSLTRRLVQAFPGCPVVAVDFASRMLDRARDRLGAPSCVEWVLADAEADRAALLERGPFDLIVSNAVVQWFSRPEETMDAYHRALPVGGVSAFATFADRTFHELADAFRLAEEALGVPSPPHVVPQVSPARWRTGLRGGASGSLAVSDELFPAVYPTVRTFLRSIQRMGAGYADGRAVVPLRRALYRSMVDMYRGRYATADGQGIVATYHIVYVTFRRDAAS